MGRGGSESGTDGELRSTVDPATLLYRPRTAVRETVEQESVEPERSEEATPDLNFDNIDDVLRADRAARNLILRAELLQEKKELEKKKETLWEKSRETHRLMTEAEERRTPEERIKEAVAERQELGRKMAWLREEGRKDLRLAGRIGDFGGFAVGGATVVAGAVGGIVATAMVLPLLAGTVIIAARFFSRRARRLGAESAREQSRRVQRNEELPEGPYLDLERRAVEIATFLEVAEKRRQEALSFRFKLRDLYAQIKDIDEVTARIDERRAAIIVPAPDRADQSGPQPSGPQV